MSCIRAAESGINYDVVSFTVKTEGPLLWVLLWLADAVVIVDEHPKLQELLLSFSRLLYIGKLNFSRQRCRRLTMPQVT